MTKNYNMQAELLKNINQIVDEINHHIKTLKETEKAKEMLLDRLSEHRNQLKLSCNINTFMNMQDGYIVMEIHNT